jgi:hypothetical protein
MDVGNLRSAVHGFIGTELPSLGQSSVVPQFGSGANFLKMSDGRLGKTFWQGLCSKNSSPNIRSRYRSAR